tara:strand:- start:604 stop:726 length:123 start_codon:yes stop_codon:yes gene_type:complete
MIELHTKKFRGVDKISIKNVCFAVSGITPPDEDPDEDPYL